MAYTQIKTFEQAIGALEARDSVIQKLREENQKLLNALYDVSNWTDDLDDDWGDPGARAQDAIEKYLKSTL
jgi:hypothetical protein